MRNLLNAPADLPSLAPLRSRSAPANLVLQLIELYEDVERWRESGGDTRNLYYILATAEQIDPQAVEALRACCKPKE